MKSTNLSTKSSNFNFSLTGEIKRGILWSERIISVKDNQLIYTKKIRKQGLVVYTIPKYVVTQNMNLEENVFTFKVYEKLSKLFFWKLWQMVFIFAFTIFC
jgi:hypothetical protein